ncbi:hypothetical protein C8R43DRAFT_1001429 [Mycena crocata]|nr:hypothetical protein C8R43DRAFT_1001429 [Mycena crocata]
MKTEPQFPSDLEREIFEITALIHPETMPTLLRVARRILSWIEPLLNRVLVPRRLKHRPPRSVGSVAAAARHLFLGADIWWGLEAKDFLKLCPGVVNLYLPDNLSDPSFLPILAEMRLQQLSVDLERLFGPVERIDLKHTAFLSLTHLIILDGVRAPRGHPLFTHFPPTLPALTHLAADATVLLGFSLVKPLLAASPRLEVLLGLWYPRDMNMYPPRPCVFDVCFVIGVYRDYPSDWEAGARGKANLWSVADAFVAQKRGGEIEASRFWLE